MLVIISDLHLTDGSSGATISVGAFEVFAERLRELALNASWRTDGAYRPVDRIDLLLLGDVLDVIRSSRWGAPGGVRPWDDPQRPDFIEQVRQITAGILRHNDDSLAVLRSLSTDGAISLPPATSHGRPDPLGEPLPVEVKVQYLVGNHDWFYHLPGSGHNAIRELVVRGMGLDNRAEAPFPHDPHESDDVLEIARRHRVFARHGDIYDPFNYEGDRDRSSLGDCIVIELLNRFAVDVQRELGEELPGSALLGLRELDNIRPTLLVPVWIDGLLERTCPMASTRRQVKQVWDRLADRFLEQPFVRERDTWSPVDLVDGLERLLKFSKQLSVGWASKIVAWLRSQAGQEDASYFRHALGEQDFRNRRARHVVYGHTHYAESVPLDASHAEGYVLNQTYFNSGTWRRLHRQTELAPSEHEFIPSDTMTYLAFFCGDERKGRPYETWSGTLGISPMDVPILRLDAGGPAHARSQQISAPGLHGRGPHYALPGAAARIVPTRRVR